MKLAVDIWPSSGLIKLRATLLGYIQWSMLPILRAISLTNSIQYLFFPTDLILQVNMIFGCIALVYEGSTSLESRQLCVTIIRHLQY